MQGTPTPTPPTRRRPIARNGVVAGSVWETRRKMDEVKGGIKVFNGSEIRDEEDDDANADEEGLRVYRRLRRNQSDGGAAVAAAERKKRKSWRAPEAVTINGSVEKSPIQLRKALSESVRSTKEEEEEVEIEVEEGRESFDDKEMDAAAVEKAKIVEVEAVEKKEEKEKEEVRIEKINEVPTTPRVEKKTLLIDQRAINPETIRTPLEKKAAIVMNHRVINPEPIRSPPSERKLTSTPAPSPVIVRPAVKPDTIKQPPPVELREELYENTSCNHRNMQNIVDLVMWRDVSKSALVFGLGTFSLISSSYTKDLNFSLISAVSYLGLVYLALIFTYKTILQRGAANIEYDERDERYMVGEEEAIWLVRLLLPYINEMLSKLRALFCGDPATTMKLALLLFAMARCGSSITLWTLAKLFFFGVFTIPKICSSYSTQLARYGKFWLERFRDGWESCTHKKAVAAAVFTLIWNVSSTVARIWAVFMLVVAVKFYQQCMVNEWNDGQEEVVIIQEGQEDSKKTDKVPGHGLQHHRQRGGPGAIEVARERKTKRGV